MMRKMTWVLLALQVGLPGAAGAGTACAIIEGTTVGGVRIGMPIQAALAITGPATNQPPAGQEIVYALRGPWSQIVAEYGLVTRVMTSAPECRTARGVAPGSASSAVRAAYLNTSASAVTLLADGEVLSYPFLGIAFVLRRNRVASIEVFRAEGSASGARPLPPAPAPPGAAVPAAPAPGPSGTTVASSATWVIRSTSAQVQGDLLTITGTIENRGPAASAYAELRAYNGTGRQVAHGDAPLTPTPVPARGVATFDLRLTIDDVVRRYTVTLRPARSLTATLAEQAGELRNLQQFGAIVARRLRIAVEVAASPATADDFSVVVTNNSPLLVASAAVSVELTVTCRLAQINYPIGRLISEQRAGNVIVQQLAPGASGRATLSLSSGVCTQFATWSATTRSGEVRIGE